MTVVRVTTVAVAAVATNRTVTAVAAVSTVCFKHAKLFSFPCLLCTCFLALMIVFLEFCVLISDFFYTIIAM